MKAATKFKSFEIGRESQNSDSPSTTTSHLHNWSVVEGRKNCEVLEVLKDIEGTSGSIRTADLYCVNLPLFGFTTTCKPAGNA
jgi:hypothetical protein